MATKAPESQHEEGDITALQFDLRHLPMRFAGGWRLDRRPGRIDGRERCLLYSPKLPMFDGYEKSAVELEISPANVLVKAESNLDASYPSQGLRVDDGALVPFEPKLLDAQTTYTTRPVQLAMTRGSALQVGLGFWPTWPVTKTQYANFDLDGFPKAYRALQACAQHYSER